MSFRYVALALVCLNMGDVWAADSASELLEATPEGEKRWEQSYVGEFSAFADLQNYYSNIYARKMRTRDVQVPVAALAILGGFSSCNPGPLATQLYVKTQHFLEAQAAVGIYYRLVVGCFKQSSETVYYYQSSELEKVKWGKPSAVIDALNVETAKSADRAVYIVGHSYGGWLALKSALALKSEFDLRGLATIDPISPVHCTPMKVAAAYLASIGGLEPEPGCVEAPRDISAEQRIKIDVRARWWHNFYQIDSAFLHSSTIEGASNHYIEYINTNIFYIFAAHMDIDANAGVWDKISSLMLGAG